MLIAANFITYLTLTESAIIISMMSFKSNKEYILNELEQCGLSRRKIRLITTVTVVAIIAVGVVFLSTNIRNTSKAQSEISITPLGFTPAELKIKKNTKVTWTNNDAKAQSITSTPDITKDNAKPILSSGTLPAGASYTYTFTSKGTYGYYGDLNFLGTVIVE